MTDLKGLGREAAGLGRVAARSFVVTFLAALLLGVVLAAISYNLLASKDHPVYGILAAVVALLECLALGTFLAVKRAVALTLLHGIQARQLGRRGVDLVFTRLLGVSSEQDPGERGGRVARAVERLPLAQAEERLEVTVRGLLNAEPSGGGLRGWVRRRLHRFVLGSVRKFTLARFRAEGGQGGVDLLKVQHDLSGRIDAQLVAKLKHGVNVWTALVFVGLPVQIFALVYIVLGLLK